MSQERISLFCFWGGNVINADDDIGYDRPFKRCIRVSTKSTYAMLVARLYEVVGVDPVQGVLTVVCRYPIVGSAGQILHRPLHVVDDDTVEAMFAIVQNLQRNHCDLYLEFESSDHATVVGETSPQLDAPTENVVTSCNEIMPSSPYNEPENLPGTMPHATSDPVRDYVQHQDMEWDYMADCNDDFNGVGGLIDDEDIELQQMETMEEAVIGDPNVTAHDERTVRQLHEPMSEIFTSVELDDSALSWAPSLRCRTWNPENEDPCVG